MLFSLTRNVCQNAGDQGKSREPPRHCRLAWGDATMRLGTLFITASRGKEQFAFECTEEWLEHEKTFEFDPHIPLTRGLHYPKKDHPVFGCLADASPDRGGIALLRRRENRQALSENRKARSLSHSDFLFGVNDCVWGRCGSETVKPCSPTLTRAYRKSLGQVHFMRCYRIFRQEENCPTTISGMSSRRALHWDVQSRRSPAQSRIPAQRMRLAALSGLRPGVKFRQGGTLSGA